MFRRRVDTPPVNEDYDRYGEGLRRHVCPDLGWAREQRRRDNLHDLKAAGIVLIVGGLLILGWLAAT